MNQAWTRRIQACVFDAYGTLFDVHSAVGKYRTQLGTCADQVSQLWRTKQLEYTWLRSLMGKHVDFWQVTRDALDFAFAAHGLTDHELRHTLMEAYLRLECYPEVPATLRKLRQQGCRTALLSNGSPTMLKTAVNHAGIQDFIDVVLSVETVGIYKPSPRVYHLAMERLSLTAEQISFQSANAWDVTGASSVGMRVVWINRFSQRMERLGCIPDAELRSLADLPALFAGETFTPHREDG